MANINLNNYFRKSTDKISPVDSHIKLNKTQTDKEKWGDLKLDLKFNELKQRPLNAKESTKDLQRIVNEQSVIVSLRNIFNTFKCSRLLNPEMSFNLGSYIFEPLTQSKAWFIGYEIYQQLPQHEPRVRIQHIDVSANMVEDCYVIKMTVSIPSVSDTKFSISSILSSQGYSIMR